MITLFFSLLSVCKITKKNEVMSCIVTDVIRSSCFRLRAPVLLYLPTVLTFLRTVVPFLHTVIPFLDTVIPFLHTVIPFLHTVGPLLSTVGPFIAVVILEQAMLNSTNKLLVEL